jgi:membrane-bound serine protease (ClpP class)
MLGDERLDVVTEGAFVLRGTPVRIARVEGHRIVVEPEGGTRGEVSIGFLVLLVVIGLVLAIAEVFLFSFGVIAVLSAVSLVSAVFLAFTHHSQQVGFLFLAASAIGAPLCVYLALKALPKTALGRSLILSGPEREQVAHAAEESGIHALLHKTGVALSDLRPAGFARLEGRRVDVITRGELLPQGTPVRVIEIEGNRVVVAKDGAQPH